MCSNNDSSTDCVRRRSSANSNAKKKRKTRKIVMIGATKCGKTALVKRFLDDTYTEIYTPTVEDCFNRDYKHKGFHLNIDIIDVCGPFMFPVMRDLNLKSADVVMLVYEIDSKSSIKEVCDAYSILKEIRQDSVSVVLVGAKLDSYTEYSTREEYEVTNDHFSVLNALDLRHMLTSAKNNINVKDAFEIGLDDIVKRIGTMSMSGRHEEFEEKACCHIL